MFALSLKGIILHWLKQQQSFIMTPDSLCCLFLHGPSKWAFINIYFKFNTLEQKKKSFKEKGRKFALIGWF